MLQHETVVTMAPAGRPSTHGQAPSPWTAWNMQAWLLFSTTMKLDRILGLQFICCFFSSFPCVIPCFASDLRNWRRAGNSTGFGGSRLWKSTKRLGLQFAAGLSPILALEFMQCLGVLDGTLSCTKEFTPRHLLQSKDWWIDWFIDLIDWLMESNVATL